MVPTELFFAGHFGCLTHLSSRHALPRCAVLARSLAHSFRAERGTAEGWGRAGPLAMENAAKEEAHV